MTPFTNHSERIDVGDWKLAEYLDLVNSSLDLTAGVAASRTAKNLVQYINHYFKYFDNLNFK